MIHRLQVNCFLIDSVAYVFRIRAFAVQNVFFALIVCRKNRGKSCQITYLTRCVEQFVKMGGGDFRFDPVIGEPTMDPALISRIRFVRSLQCTSKISMTTNAILLDRFGVKEILYSGIDSVTVSTTGFDAEAYKRVFGSNQYERMFANIVSLLELNLKRDKPIYIEIEIRPDRPIWEIFRSKDYKKICSLTNNIHFLRKYDSWSGMIGKKDLPGIMRVRKARGRKNKPCKMMLWSPMIFADGNVGACTCRDPYGASVLRLGNILETDLRDMWYGTQRRSLFSRFLEGSLPGICRSCTWYAGWDVDIYKIASSNKAGDLHIKNI
jgi:MoaA/NifB/PqqE/SkfB family radical SAM enzyme